MRFIELSKAPCNETLEVKAIYSDIDWGKRLESMGIRKGRHMRKIANQPFGGPVVIEIDSMKISLSRNIAEKIEVKVLGDRLHRSL